MVSCGNVRMLHPSRSCPHVTTCSSHEVDEPTPGGSRASADCTAVYDRESKSKGGREHGEQHCRAQHADRATSDVIADDCCRVKICASHAKGGALNHAWVPTANT